MTVANLPTFRSLFLRLAAGASLLTLAPVLPGRALRSQTPDSTRLALIAQAEHALADGRPFRASSLLAPLLRGALGRQPDVVLLAARAAAGWEGWGTVVQLLASASWLDELENGEGRALLARARVERSEPAVEDARRAVTTARPETLAERLVTLARAFDRADQLDSAAQVYRRAAIELPDAGDWLRLRAAGVLRDSAGRATLYGAVTLPAAVPRIPWTEALARSRTGDLLGAARRYDSLGAPLAAVRLRIQSANTDSARAAARRELLGLLGTRLSADDARDAIALLDASFAPLTAEAELLVARRAAPLNSSRAAAGFSRAASAQPLPETDQLAHGIALSRLGRHREAMQIFAAIRSRELRPQAEYQRARSMRALGQRAEAIAALRRVFTRFGSDSATAATAGFLAADLLVDAGDEAGARRLFRDIAHRFPRTLQGPRAAFQAALLAWIQGNRHAAAKEFAALADQPAEHGERTAAWYWSGRALLAEGDTAGAYARWQAELARFPSSYYAVRAAERLGVRPVPGPAALDAPADSSLLAALDRAALLDRIGLRVEARFEYERLMQETESAPPPSPGMRLTAAQAFLARGLVGRAYRLAPRAADRPPDRLAFPLREIPFLLEESRQASVDPLLAAAVIRQESGYDPAARSPAGALGWMQVVPAVGASLARATGIAAWDETLLYEPEINLRLGLAYLARTLRRYRELPVALAAYNAGNRVADRWSALPGAADDPDVFIERIQYGETRDYVRRILRNLAVYRALYPEIP